MRFNQQTNNDTMENQKRKKLSNLADKLLDQQAAKEALSNIKTTKTFRDSINSFLDSHKDGTSTVEYIDKVKKIMLLVSDNIRLAKGHPNFDVDQYINDKKELVNALFLMQSFIGDINHNIFTKTNLEKLNNIYREHSSINKLLT